jgi:hypothetical protein
LREPGHVDAMKRHQPEPARRWTATITHQDGRRITTTIHGPNPTEAERRYAREHPTVTHVTIYAEQYP